MRLTVSLSILFLSFVIWGYGESIATGTHLAGSQCTSCHLANEPIQKENARILKAGQELLCAGCHENAIKVSHPSGFYVERPLPEDFPKDWKGDLTCSTCHDVHGSTPGLMRVAERGAGLCTQCHEAAFFEAMRDGAASIMHSGHLTTPQIPGSELDAYSLKCMECHINKAEAPSVLVNNEVIRHTSSSVNHPIGTQYEKASGYGGYRAAVLLDPAILLPEGRLSCVSCHTGYSKEHGKMVKPAGDLCFECHDI
jgi:predicted CXXCH cytochrome family protein